MRAQRAALIIATVAIIALFAGDFLSGGVVRASLRSAGSRVFGWGGALARSVQNTGGLSSRAALARENAALRAEVAELQGQNAAAAAAKAQNDELSALVHLASSASGLTAPVTSSFRASPYGTFTIGAGSADGAKKGTLVESPDGYAIGLIIEVSSHQSLVSQFFAPQQQLDVLIDSVPVSLTGEGGGAASGDGPRAAPIHVGDIVFAPSLGQRPVGVVGEVQAGVASASTHVLVRAPTNLSTLAYVYVESIDSQ